MDAASTKVDAISSDFLKDNDIQGNELNLVARWGLLIIVDEFMAEYVSVIGDGVTTVEEHRKYTAPTGTTVTVSYTGTETVYGWFMNGTLSKDDSVSAPILNDWTVRIILKLEAGEVHDLSVTGFFGKRSDDTYTLRYAMEWVDASIEVGGATISFHGDGRVVVSGTGLTGTVEIGHVFLKDTDGVSWKVSVSVTVVSDIVSGGL